MKPRKVDAISSLEPSAGFTFVGDVITEWSSDQPQPTEAEIDAELIRLQAEYDAQEYARTRATEYPALAEQLDLLFHDMTAGKGTKSGNWYKAVNKVKTDNPKPE